MLRLQWANFTPLPDRRDPWSGGSRAYARNHAAGMGVVRFAIALINLEHYLISDLLVLLWLGLLLNAFGLFVSPSAAVLGAIIGLFDILGDQRAGGPRPSTHGNRDRRFQTVRGNRRLARMGGVGPFAVDCVGSGHLDWLRLVVVGAKAERTPHLLCAFSADRCVGGATFRRPYPDLAGERFRSIMYRPITVR